MIKRNPHRHRHAPFADALPTDIYFRSDELDTESQFPMHSHAWGEFVYSFSGMMEVQFSDSSLLAPPQYGIWLPAKLEHVGLSRDLSAFCSVYVAGHLCDSMPQKACVLEVNAVTRAILEQLRDSFETDLPRARSDKESRLLMVLLDQLELAECTDSYLTYSDDPALSIVLDYLDKNPEDNRSNQELAKLANISERTLSRRSRQDLGMSLSEWRQRLRIVRAISMLEEGRSVESIALDLGYSSASAFIAMFKKQTGSTPGRHHRSLLLREKGE